MERVDGYKIFSASRPNISFNLVQYLPVEKLHGLKILYSADSELKCSKSELNFQNKFCLFFNFGHAFVELGSKIW